MNEANSAPRIIIILNPTAGRGRGSERRISLEALLAASATGAAYEIVETRLAGDAARLAEEAAARGASIVAAAGGDGTLNEVLNGLASGGFAAKLGILPLGTGNDFARCLGNTDLESAVQTLFHGAPRTIDVGQVEFSGLSRYFLNVAGWGFDALAARRVNDFRLRRGWRHVRGTPAYLCAVLQELAVLRSASLRLEADGEVFEQRAMLCAVANATSYGGGMRVAPDAELDDGFFDICTIAEAGRIEFLRAFPSVFKGTHVSHPKVTMRRARSIRLISDPPLPVLVDGDVLGTTPVSFRILPRALEVMAPR